MLWIFYMFNAVYIDITTLYYSVFINHHAEVHYTQAFLTRSRRPHGAAGRGLENRRNRHPRRQPQAVGQVPLMGLILILKGV